MVRRPLSQFRVCQCRDQCPDHFRAAAPGRHCDTGRAGSVAGGIHRNNINSILLSALQSVDIPAGAIGGLDQLSVKRNLVIQRRTCDTVPEDFKGR